MATGREQRRSSARGRTRLPDLRRYYRHRLRDVRPGDFDFTLQLLRGKLPTLDLGPFVEEFGWNDTESVLAGSLTLRRQRGLPAIRGGYQVRCRVRWKGRPFELWTMRVRRPEVTIQSAAKTDRVELADDLIKLRQSKRYWRIRKTKRRQAPYAHQVVRIVARREGIKVGRLAKGKHRVPKIEGKMSALDVIKKAYAYEREKSGRRFIIRMNNGRVEVLPFVRNDVLYVLQDHITGLVETQEQKDGPTTVIHARGHIGKAKDGKKVKATVLHRDVVRRFGYVAREKDYGRVDSLRDLRQQAQRDLAKAIRVTRTLQVDHPGIPFIQRGDVTRVLTDLPGWHGRERDVSRDRSYAVCMGGQHSVSGGAYTMTLGMQQTDPYYEDQKRLDKERREKARARRKKRRGK